MEFINVLKNKHSQPNYTNTSRAYAVDGYILYDSDVNYLTEADLQNLSNWELKIARNEIYARKGRLFDNSSLQQYFDACSWYYGHISPNNFNDNSLNEVEKYNVNLIGKFE